MIWNELQNVLYDCCISIEIESALVVENFISSSRIRLLMDFFACCFLAIQQKREWGEYCKFNLSWADSFSKLSIFFFF